MGLSLEVKSTLTEIHGRHPKEFGKVVQKILALAFIEQGYQLVEERAIQGVDIDVIKKDTREKHSFEVKTSQGKEVYIARKDVEGLKSRTTDDYETFFAVLSMAHCQSEGWIIIPASSVKEGTHNIMRLVVKRDDELSELANESFPDVLERLSPCVLSARRGSALWAIRDKFRI